MVSAGKAMPLADALPLAIELRDLLAPACERIEIAGSIRRAKPWVSDIELVAIPRFEERPGGDLWGGIETVNLLEERVRTGCAAGGDLELRVVTSHRKDGSLDYGHRDGPAFKALSFADVPVDLFIVQPGVTDWGVIFAIRTGPADWSHRLVTDCQQYLRRVKDGRVYRAGQYAPCPEERDFFAAIGQPWVEPEERSVQRVAIVAQLKEAAHA